MVGLRRHAMWLIVIAVLGATMFGFAPVADAHTDFESSSPAAGEVVDQPVSEIQLRFTAASIIAGDGFVVLTPAGELVQPEIRVSEDEQEFTLLFEPALTNGVVGVQWSVRAGDAHPIEGAFSFTTTAEAVIGAPSTDQSGAEETITAGGAVAEPSGVEQTNTSEQAAPAAAVSLKEFLNSDTGSSGAAGPLGYLGRLAAQAGSLVAIGVIGFALFVSRRAAHETMFVYLIRQAAALTLLGSIVRATALVIEIGSVSDALISSTGLAVGLRAAGAIALLAGTASSRPVAAQHFATASDRELTTVGGGSFARAIGFPETDVSDPSTAAGPLWPSNRIGPIAIWSVAALALSFVFDGHTVTKGNHLLTGLVAVVHVVGAGVWVGGLICLVLLSKRRSSGADFLMTVVRFSVVAAVSLAAVGAAGLVLTVTILDSVSELWSTARGRILIAKVLIVGVAVLAGAFNHFVLVPEMRSVSAHTDARQSFVRTMVIELAAIGMAVALTAFLVAAAS